MAEPRLQSIAAGVVRRARQQGSVTAGDIRSELKLAGLAESHWKDVAALAKPDLRFRQGRYYPIEAVGSRRAEAEAQQDRIAKAIRALIRQHRAAAKRHDRRGEVRIDFVQPVRVHTADGKSWTLLSRDLSTTGIRILGTKQLLGQRVEIELPQNQEDPPLRFTCRILWTCAVGDELFENGGTFSDVVEG
jgi:hypothetical protein